MDLSHIVTDKNGLEIGGPSSAFRDSGIYKNIASLDNVVFAQQTVWAQFIDKSYNFFPGKSGKVFEMDAVDLSTIPNESYDLLMSSHNLEHIANPLKAFKEWIRVVKKEGHIILILPEKSVCFDHKRNYTQFWVILDKFQRNIGEDNLESLPEILRLHDLLLDSPAGNFEQFTRRSLDNFKNRCLHHHVFNKDLVQSMCDFCNVKLISNHINGLDMWFLIQCVRVR